MLKKWYTFLLLLPNKGFSQLCVNLHSPLYTRFLATYLGHWSRDIWGTMTPRALSPPKMILQSLLPDHPSAPV